VLAASKGDFGDLVKDRPKAMLRLRGKPIMTWHTDAFRRQGIRRIGAVRGYCKQALDLADIQYFDNEEHASTGELASLYTAREFLRGDVVIAYGDIVFDEFILRNLLSQRGDISIAVDGGWKLRERSDTKRDLVTTDGTYDPLGMSTCRLVRIGKVEAAEAMGEWIGLLFLRADKTEKVVKLLDHLAAEEPEILRTGDLPALLERLVSAGETVSVVHTFGHWYDLDEQKDLLRASAQVKS
jgi:phosphoenolpyruvate phosphomutase